MDSALLTHSESILLCLGMLLLLFFSEMVTRKEQYWREYLPAIYILVILQLFVDGFWFLINGNTDLITLQKALQTIYFLIAPVLGWLWFLYCTKELNSYAFVHSRWLKGIAYSLIGISSILVLLSWQYGIIYAVNEQGIYVRGPLLMFGNTVGYLFMFSASLVSYLESRKANLHIQKHKLIYQAFYSIPVFIFGILQIVMPPGFNFVYFGFIISLTMMLIQSLREQITHDNLTGLMNNQTIFRILNDKISEFQSGNSLYLGVIDIDNLKSINDEFGHTVGDNAIILTGQVIESVIHANGGQASRIHGDEFMIIIENKSEAETEDILWQTENELKNQSENFPCHIGFSWGIAGYKNGMTVKNLFNIADKRLYDQKKFKRTVKPLMK